MAMQLSKYIVVLFVLLTSNTLGQAQSDSSNSPDKSSWAGNAVSLDVLNKYIWAVSYEHRLLKKDRERNFVPRLTIGIGTDPFLNKLTYIPATFKYSSTGRVSFEAELGFLSQFNHKYVSKSEYDKLTKQEPDIFERIYYQPFFQLNLFSSVGAGYHIGNKMGIFLKGSLITRYSLFYDKIDFILPWGGLTLKYYLK
jgi:hypothetical protein